MKCSFCNSEIDTEKAQIFFRTSEGITIGEKCWNKNSTQYLKKYPNIFSFNLTSKGVYTVKIVKFEGKCLKCKVNLAAENKTGKKICSECNVYPIINKSETSKPNTEQPPTREIINNKNESVSGVIIALIILAVGSILGGLVYYFWPKRKRNK